MTIVGIFVSAVRLGIPLLFGATGEILTEKSGHLNLGIPGIMYVGGISGVIGAFFYQSSFEDKSMMNPALAILIPLLACLLGSLIMGLIYCFLTVTLRANQNVTGLAITTFGTGIGMFFGNALTKIVDNGTTSISVTETSNIYKTALPFASKLGWFGEMFLSFSFLAYVAIIISVICAFVLRKTRVGLQLRAVGENPATADAAGINVTKYKYFATCIGSMIAGLGGLFYIMDYIGGNWSSSGFGDRGWLAIALVIFAIWNPDLAIPGAILFGGLLMIYNYIPGLSLAAQEIFKMAPYVVTIFVLILTSARKKKENLPPAHLGLPYFREDR